MLSKRSFELEQEKIEKDFGSIVLYRRPDHKQPKWQCRIHITGSTGYVRRSCKTSDKRSAYYFAENLYKDLLVKQQQSGSIHTKTFGAVFREWVKSLKDGNKSEQLIDEYERRTRIYALRYFSNEFIDQITEKELSKFVQWRRKYYKRSKPSETTILKELAPLKQIFEFAYQRKYISNRVKFPRMSAKGKRRPHFTRNEYKLLYKSLRLWVKDAKDTHPRYYRDRYYLQHYVLILCNSGVRIGELRKLRWTDIEEISYPGNEEGICLWVSGKTYKRQVIPQPSTKRYLERIRSFREKELGAEPDNSEVVFCHKDGSSVGSFKKGFNTVLDEYGLRTDLEGNNHTLYSLRHTYATFRIEEGAPHYLIAQNMGTSIEMLEKHYVKLAMTAVGHEITRMRSRK